MPQIALPYFNLLDEKWIPAVMGDGKRETLSLLELFRQADAVRAVEHPSPLVTAALHRLLLAILYRSLAPKDGDGVAEWFVDGWPLERIEEYLVKWRKRFYLFHETHPFWQVADIDIDEKEGKSWSVLAAEHNASSSERAKILFDHPHQYLQVAARPDEAARWLIATQNFALAGGRGYHPSPSSFALLVFPVGGNLRETLLLNFTPQKRDVTENDFPVWERAQETKAGFKKEERRSPTGYANLYTWTSRAVRLILNKDKTVSHIGFKSAVGVDKENKNILSDPMVAYKDIGFPVAPEEHGLWREFGSLLPHQNRDISDSSSAPLVIEHSASLCRALSSHPKKLSFMACCQSASKATMISWRVERFVISYAVLKEECNIRTTIQFLLGKAEYYKKELLTACEYLIPERMKKDNSPKGKEKLALRLEQMPCTAIYWNHLELAFKQNLENGFTDHEQAEKLWHGKIRDALALAWKAQTDSVGDGDAWTIRAMTKAGGSIGKALKELSESLNEKQDAVGKEE